MDSIQVIESLVSGNVPPTFSKGQRAPVFDDSFDLAEDQRVWRQLRQLAKNCESILPELVDHFDDGRYCTTVSTSSGKTRKMTVGDACYEVVANGICEAYVRHLRTQPKHIIKQFYNEDVIGKDKLKKWCDARKGKPLFSLQIELCDWAIKKLRDESLDDVAYETIQDWIEVIKAQRESLAKSKTAVVPTWFQGEQYIPVRPSQKAEIGK